MGFNFRIGTSPRVVTRGEASVRRVSAPVELARGSGGGRHRVSLPGLASGRRRLSRAAGRGSQWSHVQGGVELRGVACRVDAGPRSAGERGGIFLHRFSHIVFLCKGGLLIRSADGVFFHGIVQT